MGVTPWRELGSGDLDYFLSADLTADESFRWLCEFTGRTHPAYYRNYVRGKSHYIGVEPTSPRQVTAVGPDTPPRLAEDAKRQGLRVRRGWLLPGSEPGSWVVRGAVRPATFVQFYVDLQKRLREIWKRSLPHVEGKPTTSHLRALIERGGPGGERARSAFGDRQAVGSYLDQLAMLLEDVRLDFERDSDHPQHVLRTWPLKPVSVPESLAGALALLLMQRLLGAVIRGVCVACGRRIVIPRTRGRPPMTCGQDDCKRELRQRRRARARRKKAARHMQANVGQTRALLSRHPA